MSIKDQISIDLKAAMKARDQTRLDTLRSVLSAFTYRRVEAGRDLAEADELAVIRKQVKQRNDSIAEYEKAGRSELVANEAAQRDILAAYLALYLGAQKSPEEVRAIVRDIIAALPAAERNTGAVMKIAMPRLKGEADGSVVRQAVTDELAAHGAGT